MTRSGSGDLVGRAVALLREGPVHTLELARAVLGLEGNPGAQSAAVFALLGSDPRFRVDGEGEWSLVDGAPPVGPALDRLRYAVVDVETTGGSFRRGHRVTEVAVVEVHRGSVSDEWRTLVNPGRSIPPRVASLTGISNETVRGAPYFDEVADELVDRLRDRVFVAHNVAFDWSFVANSLARFTGDVPDVRRLCTVRMARRLLPRLHRRNLDALSAHYGVEVRGRHRAYGDALATARILLRLLDEAGSRGILDLAALQAFLTRRRPSDPGRGPQLELEDLE